MVMSAALSVASADGAGAPERTVGILLEDGPAVPLRLVWPRERAGRTALRQAPRRVGRLVRTLHRPSKRVRSTGWSKHLLI
jgi:hypothetical protein